MRGKETIGKKSLRDDMSSDDKAKMRETAKNTIIRLRDTMSPDDKAKLREKGTIGKKSLRDGMSPDDKAKMRKKETIGRIILRKCMSPDDKAKMRGKETSGRKRLRDGISSDGINKMRRREKNDFECPRFAWAGGTFSPVVLLCQFFVLAGNRFWFYILLMYLGYRTIQLWCCVSFIGSGRK